MRFEDFILLTKSEKSDYLYKHGCFIGKRSSEGVTTVLYQVDAFYVEIFYLKYRQHIFSIRCSDNVQILDNYLEQVDINDAINSLVGLQ
jgi:hypothetical protein